MRRMWMFANLHCSCDTWAEAWGLAMLRYLFSFKGRINRAKMWRYWLFALVWEAFCFGAIWVIGTVAKLDDPIGDATFFYDTPHNLVQWLGSTVFYVFLIVYGVTLAAVSVKRLHDRGKGAIWLLLLWGMTILSSAACVVAMLYRIVPLGIAFVLIADVFFWWWLIEIFFLRGTPGDNRFGPDPLAKYRRASNH